MKEKVLLTVLRTVVSPHPAIHSLYFHLILFKYVDACLTFILMKLKVHNN